MKLLYLIFGFTGFVMIIIGAFLVVNEQLFLGNVEKTTGRVTGFDVSTDSDGGDSYCPVVEFTTRAGQTVSYDSNFCSAPPAYSVGQQVNMIYDPRNPKNAQLQGFFEAYTAPLVVGGLGFLFFGIAVFGTVFSLFQKNRGKAIFSQ